MTQIVAFAETSTYFCLKRVRLSAKMSDFASNCEMFVVYGDLQTILKWQYTNIYRKYMENVNFA